jgi:NADPH-dependent 2,4-dienoyl-CoA reductase/sulfur reductase-like enzyme
MTGFRTDAGGRIDRSRPIRFTFDGKAFEGFAGDTLASALIGNGVHLVGRSFKYHRPRGIVSAGAEEPNALVTVDRGEGREAPNLRATTVEIYDGLLAISQNRWPSLKRDFGAVANLLSPLFPAGFYYKTFMKPRAFWRHVYEPAIRRRAGLGKAPKAPDPDRYLHRYAHCDVLVVGGGPAGLAAAVAAAETGARVILCDEQAELGGTLLHETRTAIDGQSATSLVEEAVATLRGRDKVRLLVRTTAFGYFADNLVCLAERVTDHIAVPDSDLPRERIWQVRARQVVLATGAIERPLVFPENDRPGIMLAESARIYANRYGARPGNWAVIAAADNSAYRAALDLHRAGVSIAAIADLRAAPEGEDVAAAKAADIPIYPSTTVNGTLGRLRVKAVDLGRIGEDGAIGGSERVPCDLLLMAGGWTPSVHLFSQSRGKLRFDPALDAFVPGPSAQRERSAGACRGTYELNDCLAEGYAAGEAAAKAARGSSPAERGRGTMRSRWRGHAGTAPPPPARCARHLPRKRGRIWSFRSLLLRGGIDQSVAQTFFRDDPVRADLSPQDADEHLDRIRIPLVILAVDLLGQLGARDDAAGMVHQIVEHLVLIGRQLHRRAVDGDLARGRVQAQVADFDGGRRVLGLAAHIGAHAREQFAHVEGFGDVVIGAEIEALDLLAPAVAGREDQHRHGAPVLAPRLQHREPVNLRQAEVEDGQIVRLGLAKELAVLAIVGGIDSIARIRERSAELLTQVLVVLDHQYPHALSILAGGVHAEIAHIAVGHPPPQHINRPGAVLKARGDQVAAITRLQFGDDFAQRANVAASLATTILDGNDRELARVRLAHGVERRGGGGQHGKAGNEEVLRPHGLEGLREAH